MAEIVLISHKQKGIIRKTDRTGDSNHKQAHKTGAKNEKSLLPVLAKNP